MVTLAERPPRPPDTPQTRNATGDDNNCERCHMRPAVYLLGKGFIVCHECWRNPEDIMRDLDE